MTYQVVFQRSGGGRETLYWSGSLDETQKLARTAALDGDVERFLIVEFDGGEAKVGSEELPCGATSRPARRRVHCLRN